MRVVQSFADSRSVWRAKLAARWRAQAWPAPGWLGSWLASAWVLGTAVQLLQTRLTPAWIWPAGVAMSAVLLGLWALGWRRRSPAAFAGLWRSTVCLALATALLAWACTEWRAQLRKAEVLPAEWDARSWQGEARVLGLPERTESGVRVWLHAWPRGLPSPLRIQLNVPDQPWPQAPDDVMQRVRTLQAMQADERWQVALRLRQPRGLMNPNGFDQELQLWIRQVQATASPDWRAEPPRRLATGEPWRVDVWRERVRRSMAQAMQGQDEGAAQLVTALAMGDQAAISADDWQVYRDTGVAHLVSISGLHITGVAWLASLLLARLWSLAVGVGLPVRLTRQSWARWGGALVATAYAVFAGWGIPAQRTVLMLLAWCVLRQLGLRWPWAVQCLWIMVLVLLFDPWAMLQAGFWLSFVAVAVLVIDGVQQEAKQASQAALSSQSSPAQQGVMQRVGHRVWRAAWQLLRLQLLLLVALAPLTLLWFGRVSLVGLLANLLAVPWITLLITPLALLGLAWQGAWPWAADLAAPLLHALRHMAQWPVASWQVAAAPGFWRGVALVGGALFLLVPRWRPGWQAAWAWRVAAMLLMLPALLWRAPRPEAGQFEVLALDVGQGSAIVVRTATRSLLYDTGPRWSERADAGERIVLPVLQALGDRLDRVVLSHADSDHAGGAASVLAQQPSADLWGSFAADAPWAALRPNWQACVVGQSWTWDQVRFEVLFPSAHWQAGLQPSNAGSCVLRVSSAGGAPQRLLLTGDIAARQEAALLHDQAAHALRATLMMAAHHGSNQGNSAAFLQAVQPRWVWAQAGHGNRFGHPSPAMRERARAVGAQVLDTPSCGAMQWRSWQADAALCQRDLDRRYWHITP